MQVSYCDICRTVMKPNETKYILAIQEVHITKYDESSEDALTSLIHYRKKLNDEVEIKEICSKCKKIYDYLFKLRKDKLNKITKEIQKSFKKRSEKDENKEI